MDWCLVIARVSPHFSISRISGKSVHSDQLVVISHARWQGLTTLQSRIHEIWTWSFCSTLEDRLRYAPSDSFQTFPFPPNWEGNTALAAAGEAYNTHRAALMVKTNKGLTKTYNRFHDPADRAPDIERLRALHAEMDAAVLRAYGWDDLADTAQARFLTEADEDDHTYQGRLFWPSDLRDEVLARLLALNAERHAEEVRLGLATLDGRPTGNVEADTDETEEDVESDVE